LSKGAVAWVTISSIALAATVVIVAVVIVRKRQTSSNAVEKLLSNKEIATINLDD
jgi:hypothetical protein